jgi:hypothetical protein
VSAGRRLALSPSAALRPVAVLVIGCLAATLVACQSPAATSTPGPASSGAASLPSLEPPPSIGPPPSPTPPDETTPVILDSTLLEILPATIGGIAVTEETSEAAQALTDPALPKIASAMDAGVAVDIPNGNLVHAWVVKLRPDRFTDSIYRQWRDSYDEGACAAAGGVEGTAEATIDDRTVYVTTCTQGLRAYHLWLADAAILISASAIGGGNFGEILMDNLRVPA